MRTARKLANVQRDRDRLRIRAIGVGACTMFAFCPLSANAQSGSGYDLTWNTLDGGGGLSTGNGYELQGTIGQPDAGALSGSNYELNGGFWFPSAPAGAPCTTAADCKLDTPNNACNHATCPAGWCTYSCVKYGDVVAPAGGTVNLDDILCVLGGFSSFSACFNGDINPCGGNGIINLDDILAVLAAFSGANPCGCDSGGVAPLCGSSEP